VAADLKKYNLYKQAAACDGGVSCPKTILDLKKISLTIIGLDKETGDICLLAFALMQGMISCEDAKKSIINNLFSLSGQSGHRKNRNGLFYFSTFCVTI